MKRVRSIKMFGRNAWFAMVCGLALAGMSGCVGDSGYATTDDFAGFWLFESITTEANGAIATVRRDDVVISLRGDITFTAANDTDATIEVRQVAMINGLMTPKGVMTSNLPVYVDGESLVVEDTESLVFIYRFDGDRLILNLDLTDPRTETLTGPRQIVLLRADPWSEKCVGTWNLKSMLMPSGDDIIANSCQQVGMDVWARISMNLEIDKQHLFTQQMTVEHFANNACTGDPVGSESDQQYGYIEETPHTLKTWVGSDITERYEYLDFAISMNGSTLTLDRFWCLPYPNCETTAPELVVLTRTN